MAEAVLVIGANGFIGRALIQAVSAQGVPVIAVARSGSGIRRHPLVEPVSGELRSQEDFLSLVARSRAVVHLATTSTPGTSAANPLNEVNTNLHLTATLLQALQTRPSVELLYMSSGGSLYADALGTPADETARIRPRSYHGAAKLAAEAFISAWCDQFNGKATILRPSNVYGPMQPERPGFGIIPAAFGKIRRNEVLQVWGDGSAQRDYLYVDDLIRLCLRILASPMPTGARIFNASSGESVSLNGLFSLMEAVAGVPLRRCYQTDRSIDAPCIAMSSALAAREYGWRHETALQDGLRKTWEHFQP